MNDPILIALKALRRCLSQPWSDRPRAWLQELKNSLALVEKLLVQMPAATMGKILAPVAQPTQQISPGLARDLAGVRQDHLALWQQVDLLLSDAETMYDLHGLEERVEELTVALAEYFHVENELVLEATNRETGGGD